MSGKRPAAGGKGNRRVGKGKKGCVRGVGGKATLTSAEERPSCSQTKMSTSFSGQSDLLPFLRTRPSLQIPDEAQKEKVLERISSAFSSGLSNTSTSTSQLIQSSEVSPQSQLLPHSSQVSSCPSQYGVTQMAASEEMFDHTIAWESEVRSIAPVNPDVEMVCTDGQNLCESDPGTDVEGSEHNVDPRSQTVTPVGGDSEEDSEIEDDTHNLSLPSGQEEVGSEDAGCENTQGDVDDDDVGDPTYCQPTVRQSMRSSEEDASDDEVRLRLPVQRRSTGSTSTSASSTTTLPLSSSRGGTSGHKASKPCIAWAFFEVAKDDPTHVICKICQQNLSRGKQINSLSTSCMKRHMEMKHNSLWDAHCARMRPSGPGQPPSAPSCASAASSSSVTGGTAGSRGYGRRTSTSLTATASVIGSTSSLVDLEVETPAGNITCPPAPSSDTSSLRGTPYSTPSEQTIQPSVRQMWISKKPFSPSHDRAKRLNFKICKLLAGQMLPFRLVDTEDFRDLMADAVPQYQMPSRHYFSKKAVPALHQHVAHNIIASLKSSVCDRVHFTTDTWTSRHGQGRYMSLTGHWVTMVRAGEGAAVHVLPSPRVVRQSSLFRSSSTASTSSTSSRSSTCTQSLSGNATRVVTAQKESCTPPYYAGSRAQRHQAVFTLKCLGNVSHTAEELWSALETEFHKWLSPLNLQPGKAVCDNAANLGAALRRGNVTHVPCMAHVLNLVVHQFLAHYPGLDGILQRARSLCAHFRRSHPAYQRLSSIQKSLGLPVHRLKCDVPTRWNSTLHMLQRLWQHRRALVQYVMTYSLGHRDPEVGQITLQEWSQIRDLCTLLHSFEMATNMFSADDAIISMTIPVIYMLEQTLLSIRSQVVGQEEEGEEVQEESYAEGRISTRSRRLVAARRQALEGEGEGLMRAHGSRQTVEQRAVAEEEVEDELPMGVADSSDDGDLEDISVVRGWGERAFEGSMTVLSPPPTQQGLGPRGCARHMSAFLLHYLQHDPRIVKIRSSADYWLATLLDPRYKNKFMELIPAIERDSRMQEYQQTLLHNLRSAFPQNTSGARSGSESQSYNLTPVGLSSYHSNRNMAGGGNSNFVESFHQFFRPSFARPQETRSLTHSQRLERMVQEYLEVNIDGMTVEVDPCSFWASNLEKWPELATHALEVLSCPAASVLSERVFSAAGGVLTDKRTRLSTESVDRLTFIKMNKSWIRKDFSTPVSSWGD